MKGGCIPEEVLDGRLEKARLAIGPDAQGFVLLVGVQQELLSLESKELDESSSLLLLGRLVHALAVAPFPLSSGDAGLMRVAQVCAPFVRVAEAGTVGLPGSLIFPEILSTQGAILPDWVWGGTDAGTALRAAGAAICLLSMGDRVAASQMTAVENLCSRLVAELSKAPTAAAVQADLAAAQSAADVGDIRYVSHFILGDCAHRTLCMLRPDHYDASLPDLLTSPGMAEAMARWKRGVVGMTAAKPHLPAGYEACARVCLSSGQPGQAAKWAERGIQAADAAGSSYHGASLRYKLGSALIVQSSREQTGIQAGRLRRLLAEAREREARCKPWVPRSFLKKMSAGPLKGFLDSVTNARDTDMVVAGPAGRPPPPRQDKPCGGCGVKLADARLCSACKQIGYCSQACQKKHWPTHKAACKAACKAATAAGGVGTAAGAGGSG